MFISTAFLQTLTLVIWIVLTALVLFVIINEFNKHHDLFSPLICLSATYYLFFGFSPLFYLFYPFKTVLGFYPLLLAAMLIILIGYSMFVLGYETILLPRWLPFKLPESNNKEVSRTAIVLTVISLFAAVVFFYQVGGVSYYVSNWGITHILTKGKMYLIALMLVTKIAFLILAAFTLRNRINQNRWDWLLLFSIFVISFVVTALIGSRLLLLAYLIEALIVFHYLWRAFTVKQIVFAGICLVVVGVVLMGELRSHTWNQDKTLLQQAQATFYSVEKTGDTLFNHYFDSVMTLIVVMDNIPRRFGFEMGRTYLELLVRPIPYQFRPGFSTANLSDVIPGGVISSQGEAYLNFGLFGVILIMFMYGAVAKLAYSWLRPSEKRWSAVVLFAIILLYLMIFLRGSFASHTSIFLIDLVPALSVFILLSRR